MEKVIITNMCMLRDGTRVLVQDRIDPDWPGLTFPGGHVEQGESLTDAVIREVYEETGLTITSPRLCGVKDWMETEDTRYLILLYQADQFQGSLVSSKEGPVFWMELEDLLQKQLAEGMKETLAVFLEEAKSEHYIYQKQDKWIDSIK